MGVLVTIVTLLFINVQLIKAKDVPCTSAYRKIGCFKRQFSNQTLILNDMDLTFKDPDGQSRLISWMNYQASIQSLVCRCAAIIKTMGLEFFTINNFGECWSSTEPSMLNVIKKGEEKQASCIGPTSSDKNCPLDGKLVCAGMDPYSYLYELIIDGNWCTWGDWNDCNKDCEHQRRRVCNNPAPRNGGKLCDGDGLETKDCIAGDCIMDGNWGEWENWNLSTDKCVKSRTRICNNPAARNGGEFCVGNHTELSSVKKCLKTPTKLLASNEAQENKAIQNKTVTICPSLNFYRISCTQPEHVIQVNSATYQGNWQTNACNFTTSDSPCKADVSPFFEDLCDDRENCGLFIDERNLPRICKDVSKYIQINYSCIPSTQKRKILCENTLDHLSCPNGTSIAIERTYYGHKNHNYCKKDLTKCPYKIKQRPYKELLNTRCLDRQKCWIDVTTDKFGSGMCAVSNYLEVKYKCK